MKPPNLITLRVWGDFACFTRPEMKVERVSYSTRQLRTSTNGLLILN